MICYLYTVFGNIIAFEVCHTHKRLFIIHAIVDNLSSGILVNSIVQLVLHRCKEHLCHFTTGVIVLSAFENLLICFLFFVVNTVLFSLFLVFAKLCFCYVIDYYIYKALKELEAEKKKHNLRPFRVHYVCKNVR